MTIIDTIQQRVSHIGVKAFGLTMPRLNGMWVATSVNPVTMDQVKYSREKLHLELEASAGNWLAPFGGFIHQLDGARYPLAVNLFRPDGSVETSGSVLALTPQAYYRLRRLYANVLETETAHNPCRPVGESIRPAPRYLHFLNPIASDAAPEDPGDGQVAPGDDLGVTGEMRIYDERGYPIDPLAVVSALLAITEVHEILRADDPASDQLSDLVNLANGPSFQVRLVEPDGSPYQGQHLKSSLAGDGGVLDAVGLFSVNAYNGTDPGVLREIKRDEPTDANGTFPLRVARQLLISPATYGRMSDAVHIPSSPIGVTLTHDFLTIEVELLEKRLLGVPDPNFYASKIEPRPVLRLHDHIKLLSNGNQVLGGLGQALAGNPADSYLVGETIAADVALPESLDAVYWPDWPPLSSTVSPDLPDTLPSGLKAELSANATASFIDNPDQTVNVDILLTLKGLPLDSAVRVFNRKLGRDFVEERGAGAGAVVSEKVSPLMELTYQGMARLLLKDPLGLITPMGTTAAVKPILNIDVVIVTRSGVSRVFGNLELAVDDEVVSNPITPVDNGLTTNVEHRGVAHAGLVGLPAPGVDLSQFLKDHNLLEVALALLGDQGVLGRDAPRLPLMRRRSLIAAARVGANWQASLSAGAITTDLHAANSRSGSPGSPGGRDVRGTGLYTQNGLLAYDLARAALRRTNAIYSRKVLIQDDWNEPSEPVGIIGSEQQTDTAGPFASALLHTIAPMTETPELHLFEPILSDNINPIPADLNSIIAWLETQIDKIDLSGLPINIKTQVEKLKAQLINWINDELLGSPLDETKAERIYYEIIRELSAACYGRRDSLWSLEGAVRSAGQFIYLETPAIAPVAYGTGNANYTRDILSLIKDRMEQVPALKLIICTPKVPFYGEKYRAFQRREVHERFGLFVSVSDGNGGMTTPLLPEDRTVVFHPLGFPGRPAGLTNQTIIIDDNWMLTGATTMRRRGFTFDEGHDVVLTGLDRHQGRVPQIQAHRIALLAEHLNLTQSNKTTLEGGNFTRLADGRAAFDVVREILRAGGYGLIERLYSGLDPHVGYTEPTTSPEIYNPEGQTYQSGVSSLVEWLNTAGTGTGGLYHDF